MKNASLKNKTVIVTAGNQGGGAIVAARFAEAGAKVAIIAHTDPLNKTPLTQVSDNITQSGGTAQTWTDNRKLKIRLHIQFDGYF